MRKQIDKPIENPNRAIFNYTILDNKDIESEDYDNVFNYYIPYNAEGMTYSSSILDSRYYNYVFGLPY
jgi:hypothetical protein